MAQEILWGHFLLSQGLFFCSDFRFCPGTSFWIKEHKANVGSIRPSLRDVVENASLYTSHRAQMKFPDLL
jgi:hypothetical protein